MWIDLYSYIQSYNKKHILFNHSVYLYGQLNDTYVYELHEFFLILIHRYNVYILGWMIILGDYIQAIRIWISEYFTFRSTIRSWTTWIWIRRRIASDWHWFKDRYHTRPQPGYYLAAVQGVLPNDRSSNHPRVPRP